MVSEISFKDIRDIALEPVSSVSRAGPQTKYLIVFLLRDGSHVEWTTFPAFDVGRLAKIIVVARAFGGWDTAAAHSQASPTTATLRPFTYKSFRLAFLLSGLLSAYGAGRLALEIQRLRTWQPVPATVIGTDVRAVRGSRGFTNYQPLITYTYEVGGRIYTSETVHALSESGSSQWAVNITSRYPPGLLTTAYADPNSPSKAFLIHELRPVSLWYLIMGLVIIVIAWLQAQWMARQLARAIAAAVPVMSARRVARAT